MSKAADISVPKPRDHQPFWRAVASGNKRKKRANHTKPKRRAA